MYAYEIHLKFARKTAWDWFHLQIPDIFNIVGYDYDDDDYDYPSYKWFQWAPRKRLLLQMGFEFEDWDFFKAVRLKFEDLNPVGFKTVFRALAMIPFDPAKVNTTTAKVITKLDHPKQFALGIDLY